jgi:NAD(P)-dependent dehydrogenase (short-subunit alcohol dehydrogenase family)
MRRQPQVILITGASTGIGRACADHLHRLGHRVYGAARSFPDVERHSFTTVQMDVRADDSVLDCVRQVLAQAGRIDVLVNSAGYALAGAIEDTSIAEAQAQFETNFFGVVRVCQAVLPVMRQQQTGLIVNVSSIGGLLALPFQGFYSASKFALEGLTEALRLEVSSYGVRVVLIEPGDFQTRLTANRHIAQAARESTAYQASLRAALAVIERDETNGHLPVAIARLLERIIDARAPQLRYLIGPWSERAGVTLKKFLPHKLYERLLLRHYQ